jgi:hypothetical protein
MKPEPRIYLTGNTYPVREEIKAAGGKWDPERKAWWVTPDKRPAMLRIAAKVRHLPKAQRGPKFPPGNHDPVIGEARLANDNRNYLIGWMGRLKNGPKAGALFAKLITLDGTRSFWKTGKEIRILRRFEEPQPLGHILHQLNQATS